MSTRLFCLVFFLATLLSGCVHKTVTPGTGSLVELQGLHDSGAKITVGISAMRQQVLQNTAMTLAAQAALAARSTQINAILEKNDATLRAVFNFQGLVLSNNVLPPVLIESRDELNLADDRSIRLSDRTYEILEQAKFITAPPTWRDYLEMHYSPPPVPGNALLPRDASESVIWHQYIDRGWEEGIRQADAIFSANLSRLKREFVGMVLYRKLLAQKMVSPPYVARTQLGITGSGSALRINDQVLRITALPELQSDASRWQPKTVPHE